MSNFSKVRGVQLGSGVALAVAIAMSVFSPAHFPAEQPAVAAAQAASPDLALARVLNREAGSIHVDAVKRSLEPCAPARSANEAALVERAWRLPVGGVTYYINMASVPSYLNQDEVVRATQAAAAAWTAGGAPALVFGGTVGESGFRSDGQNVVSFSVTGIPDVAALSVMRYTGGVITEADIFLDVTNLWSTNAGASGDCGGDAARLDVQNTLAHEFGHWVGAAHPKAAAEYIHRTMFPELWAGELQKRTLSTGDVASIPSQDGPPSGNTGEAKRGGDDDG